MNNITIRIEKAGNVIEIQNLNFDEADCILERIPELYIQNIEIKEIEGSISGKESV